MNLTTDNYYTTEADMQYMSCSQYQSFCECEAKALAKLQGRWKDKENEAFMVGKYFHSYFEGSEAFEIFQKDNFDSIFKTKTVKGEVIVTGKYAPYVKADEMIKTAENDELIKRFIDMPGENEKIMTGRLFGIDWRIRVDKYISESRMIIDWKTVANIQELKYNPITKLRESFMELHGYVMRASVYCQIEKQFVGKDNEANFVIVAISKQEPCDKEMFLLNHKQRFKYELEEISKKIVRINKIKEGLALPRRCGICDYCRTTKKLKKIVPYYSLDPEFNEGKEVDNIEFFSTKKTMLAES